MVLQYEIDMEYSVHITEHRNVDSCVVKPASPVKTQGGSLHPITANRFSSPQRTFCSCETSPVGLTRIYIATLVLTQGRE